MSIVLFDLIGVIGISTNVKGRNFDGETNPFSDQALETSHYNFLEDATLQKLDLIKTRC